MGKLLIGKVTHPLKDNLETTEPGQGSLDARQGNALRDMIDSLGLNVGDLTALQTTDKDSLVNAINNLADAVSTLNSKSVPDMAPHKKGSILNITDERNGIWYFASAANGVTEIPEGTWGMVKYDKIASGLIFITFIVGDTGRQMTAVYNNGWSNWR